MRRKKTHEMNPEESKALQAMIEELIEFLDKKKVGEFRLERGELKIELKFAASIATAAAHGTPGSMQLDPALLSRLMGAPAAPVQPAVLPTMAEAVDQQAAAAELLHTVKSPIVGTFYESPSPGSPAVVKPGDHVAPGPPLCSDHSHSA